MIVIATMMIVIIIFFINVVVDLLFNPFAFLFARDRGVRSVGSDPGKGVRSVGSS